jgi:hypothetical protein
MTEEETEDYWEKADIRRTHLHDVERARIEAKYVGILLQHSLQSLSAEERQNMTPEQRIRIVDDIYVWAELLLPGELWP